MLLRFASGFLAGAELTPSSPLAFPACTKKRLGCDGPGMVLGFTLSATAALLSLEGRGWQGFSGLWFSLRRGGLLQSG